MLGAKIPKPEAIIETMDQFPSLINLTWWKHGNSTTRARRASSRTLHCSRHLCTCNTVNIIQNNLFLVNFHLNLNKLGPKLARLSDMYGNPLQLHKKVTICGLWEPDEVRRSHSQFICGGEVRFYSWHWLDWIVTWWRQKIYNLPECAFDAICFIDDGNWR